ncbi:ferritin-like domain-containing protein [Hymenobacter sp. UV11]|uniref:ferritin-like domain-containing protein n=1 Tax=Hymenobacter sp. UV11 TaxID=1849735 RepID=UPI00105BDB41|nr:ferritin-like domain-containing protein [Hymenobacter sp. UV11]TDN37327.1 Tat (twin-arginine translocation) pathway signal sequence containing protein [Hymenobacter sp. UV11]TFZ68514.1 ferritin-like domain-containing protein [Hymenobacter sp. UV11]
MPTTFPSDASSRPATSDQPLLTPIKRRSFFMYAGATAGATALVLAGCSKSDSSPGTTDVGSGDFGVLNYAYALEQLEAAFYAQVLAGSYFTNLPAGSAEKQIFTDLALHEKIHADFLKTALGTNAIKALTPDFSSITFSDRLSVLNAAQAFEDLGVQAYNGAGRYITSADYLTLAGKIVSVEARHAALIRDLISYNSFVGPVTGATVTSNAVIDPSLTSATARMEQSKSPTVVLATANMFLAPGSKLTANSFM